LSSTDRPVRRCAARILIRRSLALPALDQAVVQDDSVTLTLLADAALPDAPVSVVERLSNPPLSARVRALPLDRLLVVAPEMARRHAERSLMDRSPKVRAVAQRFLETAGVDVAGLYAAHLTLGRRPRRMSEVAIRGLTEVGAKAQFTLIAAQASHPSPRVREAVCSAIETLAPDQKELLFTLVGDSSRRVARRAALALVRSGIDPAGLDRLWECAIRRSDAGLLTAFVGVDRWRQLLYAARGLRSGEPLAVSLGSALMDHVLATWNSGFSTPPASARDELSAMLPVVLRRIPKRQALVMRLSLRPFLPNL
jgi:hypothetical protein